MAQTTDSLPRDLEKARARFDAWRAVRAPRERIPEKLWDLAIRSAGRHGPYKTSRALRLDYMGLRRRMPGGAPGRSLKKAATHFVEVTAARVASTAQCVAWIESPAGVRMRLELRGLDPAAVAAFARSFAGGEG